MANKRNISGGRRIDQGRDAGGFVALPWSVLDCPAYAALSHPARALLLEFARQLGKDNNGRLLSSRAYLIGRGWKSADVIQRAKTELLAADFIFETVKGQRPNRASWYAVTWRVLDRHPGYDVGTLEGFRRGAYRHTAARCCTCLPVGRRCPNSKTRSLDRLAEQRGAPLLRLAEQGSRCLFRLPELSGGVLAFSLFRLAGTF